MAALLPVLRESRQSLACKPPAAPGRKTPARRKETGHPREADGLVHVSGSTEVEAPPKNCAEQYRRPKERPPTIQEPRHDDLDRATRPGGPHPPLSFMPFAFRSCAGARLSRRCASARIERRRPRYWEQIRVPQVQKTWATCQPSRNTGTKTRATPPCRNSWGR